jgi:hypothetical protein
MSKPSGVRSYIISFGYHLQSFCLLFYASQSDSRSNGGPVCVDDHFDSFLRELEANMYYSEELTALNTKIQDSEALLNSAITAKDIMEYRITNLTGSVKEVIEELAHTFDGVMATLRHELELISNIVVKREAPPPTDWELLEVVPQVKRPRRIVHLASGTNLILA